MLVAYVSDRHDDVVNGEVCEVSLAKQRLDRLLRLSKESFHVVELPKARFRVVIPPTVPRQYWVVGLVVGVCCL